MTPIESDWAGRAIRNNKVGAILSHLSLILERIGIEPNAWLDKAIYWCPDIPGCALDFGYYQIGAAYHKYRINRYTVP